MRGGTLAAAAAADVDMDDLEEIPMDGSVVPAPSTGSAVASSAASSSAEKSERDARYLEELRRKIADLNAKDEAAPDEPAAATSTTPPDVSDDGEGK